DLNQTLITFFLCAFARNKNRGSFTALSGVMRYTTGGQDAHPTRVLLLKFVPHSNGICCK
ncbi:MAG: hypothetical protein ACKPE1_28915, partial [Dolichospermum sp.]